MRALAARNAAAWAANGEVALPQFSSVDSDSVCEEQKISRIFTKRIFL